MVPRDAAVARTGAEEDGAAGDAAGSCAWRSVMEFRNFTDAISRLSISEVVLDSRNMCDSNSVMATPRPDAVLFIATEIAAASKLAFSAGLAVATALKALMRPMMVPSNPINKPTLASDER